MKVSTLRKGLEHPRFDLVALLKKTGWYSDGRVAVKLPTATIKSLRLINSTSHGAIPNNLPSLVELYSDCTNEVFEGDTVLISERGQDIGIYEPVKKGSRSFIRSTKVGEHQYVTDQLKWVESLFPNIKWFHPKRGMVPLVGKVGNKTVALITPMVDDENTDTGHRHVKVAKAIKRRGNKTDNSRTKKPATRKKVQCKKGGRSK